MRKIKIISLIIMLNFLLSITNTIRAQEFAVSSFRSLDNDVTAFITPIFDNAGDACALVRVVGNSDFAFSTPLGIVRRTDKTGEILLYLPKGSKTLTIKHPQWGVIRDYSFGQKLVSQHTYELRLSEPLPQLVVQHDTVTQTVRDTITVIEQRPRTPLSSIPMVTVGIHQHGPSMGVMFSMMRQHGAYIHAQWNMHRSVGGEYECDDTGKLNDGTMPYYTGKTHNVSYALTAGAIHRLSRLFSVYEGIGYGLSVTSWQLSSPGDDVWARNTATSYKGLAFELGTVLTPGRINTTVGISSISAKTWSVNIGVGIAF